MEENKNINKPGVNKGATTAKEKFEGRFGSSSNPKIVVPNKNNNANSSRPIANSNSNSNQTGKRNDKVIVIKKRGNRKDAPFKKNFKKDKYNFEVVEIKRIVKVVKGGRKFRFSVLVVLGDQKGSVGYGVGKSNEIPVASAKARSRAEKNMIHFKINQKSKTIPHSIKGKYEKTFVLMHPAPHGTGVIAGGPIRTVLNFCGVENIYTKVHGSRNKLNMIKAAINGLENLRSYSDIKKLKEGNDEIK